MCRHLKRTVVISLALFTLGQLAGCSVRPKLEKETVPPELWGGGDAPLPTSTLTDSTENHEYKLGSDDVLIVKFFNNEDYNEEVKVRPDGRISLQRIGDILVQGMTPTELTNLITEKYSEIIRNPDVTVIVSEFGGNAVYVLGEVEAPGCYDVKRNMTMIRALAAAGGPTDEASLSSVMLIRMIDKKRISAKRVDLSIPMLQKDPALDLDIRAYDIVYIPKTFVANIRSFVTQIYDTVLPPLDLYARSVFWSRAWK